MAYDQFQNMAQAKPHKTTQFRHEESGDHSARGQECLLLAQSENYQNQALLIEASDCFMDAIKHNRKQFEPYLGLGFIFWLYEEYDKAKQYLEVALHLAPDNPDVHTLLKSMPGGYSLPATEASASLIPDGLPQIDKAAKSIEEIEVFLEGLTHDLDIEKLNAIVPSVNELYIERLEDKTKTWQYRYKQLSHWIKLSHSPEFLNRLDPLKGRIRIYQKALADSYEMGEISQEIRENEKNTQLYIDSLASNESAPQDLIQYLETLLDNCDVFADQVDALEERGLNIRTLNSHYQQLCDALDTFQDAMEV